MGWQTFSSLFIFLKNNLVPADPPGGSGYILQQCETSHKLSMAFEIQASDSTCILLEFFPLVFLAACPPAERGGVHLWSAGARGLSRHLQHARSEESPTGTEPSYCLNTISSYLINLISTRQGLEGCTAVVLFSWFPI